jgi:hypothetical protein
MTLPARRPLLFIALCVTVGLILGVSCSYILDHLNHGWTVS